MAKCTNNTNQSFMKLHGVSVQRNTLQKHIFMLSSVMTEPCELQLSYRKLKQSSVFVNLAFTLFWIA